MAPLGEPSISIRLVWPFARVATSTETVLASMDRPTTKFADPDARVPRAFAMRVLAQEAERMPAVGFRAAELSEPHDFDVVEYAARSASTLGDAARCLIRYFELLDDAAAMSLTVEGDRAVWRLGLKGGLVQPPAANDFAIATALGFSRRNTARYETPIEIHLAHEEPAYLAEYEAFGAPVLFGAPCNAIVIRAQRLFVPMARANPQILRTFEEHAARLLGELKKSDGVRGRVRRELLENLRRGSVSMAAVAERQAMAVATLRRHLEEEGTTFLALLEEARRDLALEYLRDRSLTLTEIAFLLGYGSVSSFGRAFVRWTGRSPASHRADADAETTPRGARDERGSVEQRAAVRR